MTRRHSMLAILAALAATALGALGAWRSSAGDRGVRAQPVFEEPCDAIQRGTTCIPIPFDLVIPCGEDPCAGSNLTGRRCAVRVLFPCPDCPLFPATPNVSSWWVIRSLDDGRRYYVWDGAYSLLLNYTYRQYVLCAAGCNAAIEAFGLHFSDRRDPTEDITGEVVANECVSCRRPTPTPRASATGNRPWLCMPRHYLPLTLRGATRIWGN